jgi:hypothetical protein
MPFELRVREGRQRRPVQAIGIYRPLLNEISRDQMPLEGRRRRTTWVTRSEYWGNGRVVWRGRKRRWSLSTRHSRNTRRGRCFFFGLRPGATWGQPGCPYGGAWGWGRMGGLEWFYAIRFAALEGGASLVEPPSRAYTLLFALALPWAADNASMEPLGGRLALANLPRACGQFEK